MSSRDKSHAEAANVGTPPTLAWPAPTAVRRGLGGLVLLAVLLSVAGCRFAATSRSLMVAGAAAGLMGAMVGIHGPPISLVFQNTEPRKARGMLSAFFSVAYLGAVAALAAFGLFGIPQLICTGILLPGVAMNFATPAFEELLAQCHPTWFTGSPAMHLALLEHFKRVNRAPIAQSLQFFRSSSAPLPASTIGNLEQLFRAPLIETYRQPLWPAIRHRH